MKNIQQQLLLLNGLIEVLVGVSSEGKKLPLNILHLLLLIACLKQFNTHTPYVCSDITFIYSPGVLFALFRFGLVFYLFFCCCF